MASKTASVVVGYGSMLVTGGPERALPAPLESCRVRPLGARASARWLDEQPVLEQAIARDALATESVELASLWRELSDGRTVIYASFFSPTRCGLIFARSDRARLDERRRAILEAMLSGRGQKRIAIEMALSPSTVAANARIALESFGVAGWPSRTHPLLMLAATASVRNVPVVVSLSELRYGAVRLRIVGSLRPEYCLRDVLPRAEFAVTSQLLEGRSYAEIARLRGTSLRTVANQFASVFHRLKGSGRTELMQRLFLASGWLPDSSPPVMPRLPRPVPLGYGMRGLAHAEGDARVVA